MLGKRTLGLALGMALLLPLLAAISWTLRGCATVGHKVPLESVEDLRRHVYLYLPADTRLVEGHWFNALNSFGYAKVELSPAGLHAFLAQAPFGGEALRSTVPVDDEHNPVHLCAQDQPLLSRWQLRTIRHSLSAVRGELNRADSHFPVAVFVDLDHPEHPIAYLHWYD